MHVLRRILVLGCICTFLPLECILSQNLLWRDSILVDLKQVFGLGNTLVMFHVAQDMEYQLTCSGMVGINREHGSNFFEASLLQHFRYQALVKNECRVKFLSSFVHDLGVDCFFDSISRFQPDENALAARVEVTLARNFVFTVSSQVTTRIFNAYDYSISQTGTLLKTRIASFLTPLLGTLSAGFGWTVPRYATLGIGLSSAKFTCILDQSVFDRLKVTRFYGVPREKSHLFEYGLSMHMLLDHDFTGRVHWNCDMQVFKNYHKPVDLVMTSLVGIKLTRLLRTSIRTYVSYDSDVSRNLRVENVISLGVCFNL